MKKIISILLVIIMAAALCISCGNEDYSDVENPVATIVVKDYGTITVELYPSIAPNTVKNFISLANDGFYDGLIFHRVIKNFMIQGGCPNGTGTGDPGYSIKGEFRANGVENNLSHTRGVISMARASYSYDTQGSQFFIMHKNYPSLDGQYAAFGKVVDDESMAVVDKIAVVATNPKNDKPLEDVVIEKITVDTKGVKYGEPDKIGG